jgi:hypothetical protein
MFLSLQQLGSLVLDVYGHRLEAAFIDTTGNPVDSFAIHKGATTGPEVEPLLPPGLLLGDPLPNPASHRSRIPYSLPRSGSMVLDIVDVQGRRVIRLLDGARDAGPGAATWDGRSGDGRRVAAGTYFALLRFGGELRARKLVIAP